MRRALLLSETSSRPKLDCSGLTVIWFQDEYAFPLSEDAERAIHTLDWQRLASEGTY